MSPFSFNLSDFVFVWWSLLYEAIPFVALGALVSGIMERCLSREMVVRLFPRRRSVGILTVALLGLLLPLCECGVVPIVRRLIRKGVPVSCAVAYLLAAPIINPLTIASTVVAFRAQGGWYVAALRVALAYLVTVIVAAMVWKLLGEDRVVRDAPETPSDDCHARRRPALYDVLSVAGSEFIAIGGILVLGAAIAAVINSGFSRSSIAAWADNPLLAVPGMMGLAVVLNLCSEADAFVAASFNAFPLAAKLAFLVLGPMVDVKLILIYMAVFRPRAALAILGLVVLLVLMFCLAAPWWLPLTDGRWLR
jgi:hypothetical protein